MPETAVYEECDPTPSQDQVWSSWKIRPMQSEAKTKPMYSRANHHFRASILGSDTRHVPAAVLLADAVHVQRGLP
jgi:hypothetical protein